MRQAGIPDARWANGNLPITDVAAELGCGEAIAGKLHCWHAERHQNGDRTASVGIKITANRLRCFGCAGDSKFMNVVDLVMDYLSVDPTKALRWLDEHFVIPRLPKGAHLKDSTRRSYEVGKESVMQGLVRSGVWAKLPTPAQKIFPVLMEMGELDEKTRRYKSTISYLALRRYSGVGSDKSVKVALDALRDFFLLEFVQVPGTGSAVRAVSSYLLTPYSDEFLALANAVAGEQRIAVSTEREFRRIGKRDRLVKLKKQEPAWSA
jgi:hypothetical protein